MKALVLCASLALFGGGFEEAPLNFSSHEICVTHHIPQGVSVVFVDKLSNPDVLGTLAQFVTVYDGETLRVYESAVLIAVESALNHGVSLSEVISHELVHVRQLERYPNWKVFRSTYEEGGTTSFETEAFRNQRALPIMALPGKRRPSPHAVVVYY